MIITLIFLVQWITQSTTILRRADLKSCFNNHINKKTLSK